jgi:hypothetical protein
VTFDHGPVPVTLWTPARAREEARSRVAALLAAAAALPLVEVAEGFLPLGAPALDEVLCALERFAYDADPAGAEALVMAAGSLLRAHLAAGRASRDALWDRSIAALSGLLARAPNEEGPWQTLLSMTGQVLGDHLPEQVVWLDRQSSLPAGDREARLEEIEAALESVLEAASPPGRAGAIVGLHQIVQFAHQQRNMRLLSDLAQGDEDDLVRSVARQALHRAMDANFDLVY